MNYHSTNNKQIKTLDAIPCLCLAHLPTALEKLDNLNKLFDHATVFIKRDDLTGHCFGGNKERKLEFIIADVLKKKATVVVTVGVLQSNHCRMVVALANRFDLKTELILIDNKGIKKGGNHFLDKLMDAKIHIVKVNEVKNKIKELLDDLRDKGEKPYFIEGGGHNVLGGLGYVCAIRELKKQTKDMGILPDYLVLPTGTGTTQSGLILGTKLFDYNVKVVGISIARKKEKCISEIATIIKKTEEYLNIDNGDYKPHIKVFDNYIGQGYGIPTREGMEALKLMAKKEGLIIDPTYNAKAMAGMCDLILKEKINGNIIYLNTGGLPALFTQKYFDWEDIK